MLSRMSLHSLPRVAVLGAGAVGCYYGGMLARAGVAVTLVGRAAHVDAINERGLLLDTLHFREHVRAPASEHTRVVADADVVLVCVKSGDTEAAARAMRPHLHPGALVVSLQNGVDNAERIAAATGREAVAGVVYVGAHMAGPGHVRHTGRGELVVGALDAGAARREQADRVASLFAGAGVPCRVAVDIRSELWTKLVLNCAYNAMSALTRLHYGPMLADARGRALVTEIVAEAHAVARAAGVVLGDAASLERVLALAEAMPTQVSSTSQDIALGRRTEIDALNGYLVRQAEALGVDVPVNRTLHALVKLRERSAAAGDGTGDLTSPS
jgi:2-dehydropantoate 2-reductase